MKRFIHVLLAASLLHASSASLASDNDDFLEAEKVAWSGNYKEFKRLNSQLDHPLKPYVEMAFYKRHPQLKYQTEIERFLSVYQNTPLEWPVRRAWLNYLAKRGRKADFVANYQPTSDAQLKCQYLDFQLQLGAPERAILAQVADLWVVGQSQPKQCDSLFAKWRDAGMQTPQRVWQRVGLAAREGEHYLLRYLKTLLPNNERYLADLYSAVRKDPSAAAGLYRFKNKSSKEAEIAHYGVKRLVWRDPELAIRAWTKLDNMFTFTDEQRQEINYAFAYALAVKQHDEAKFWLNKVPDAGHDKKLMQWHLANMLREQDWPGISAYFTNKTNLSNGHKYWLAYSYFRQGRAQEAQNIWLPLAQQRDYYGFLAAARLDQPVNLNSKQLMLPPGLKEKVAQAPGFKRAKRLHELKRYTSARREWNYLIDTSSEAEKLAASVLAGEQGWHDSTIFTLARIKAWDYVDLRFPDAFTDLFKRYSRRNKVDMDWSIAIARRESSFAPDARSRANARGLMQLLPSTAKYINRSTVSSRRLYEPSTNINLGTKYLKYLEGKTNGNQVLATASYNAGYHRVRKWLPDQAMPAELWIELIPYRETRDYVKNVFAYRQVYLTKQGKNENILASILDMRIGG
ncbi:transglycosylase SLT domain-containing protein [Pseudoalteromonas ruthenica]|uniref:transglycosylase SLT domain-containing protein n=1 Tax=Pseudoalteromonas ruthenica TaxID=151081 RepID=UPI00124940EE|nr:transglycosylase SLT domain-containing protein [Pseudoalteromonas ruthenica]